MSHKHRLLAAAAALLFALPLPAAAADSTDIIPVTLAGEPVCAGQARLIDERTYMPLRSFCEAMGVDAVRWSADERAAYAEAEGLALRAGIDERWITVNGRAFGAPEGVRLVDGVTMVPIRPLARAFGLDVSWDGGTRSVTLTDSGTGYAAPASAVYDEEDLYWLSRIISAESRGEPFVGQLAVGNVVLNRVASDEFPDSIYGVVFDRKWGVQFSPVANGTIYAEPAESAVLAAKLALEGYTVSEEILYFLNPRLATNFWIPQNRPFAMTIGTHDFYT